MAKRSRKRGDPTEAVHFRCPTDLYALLGDDKNRSAQVVALMEIAADARAELGEDWIEVVVRSAREDVDLGVALARWAREGIHGERKRRK